MWSKVFAKYNHENKNFLCYLPQPQIMDLSSKPVYFFFLLIFNFIYSFIYLPLFFEKLGCCLQHIHQLVKVMTILLSTNLK